MSHEPGSPYRPSNGTEGMIFEEKFCNRCKLQADDTLAEDRGYCEILTNSMLYEIGDPEYPKEWVYNDEGWGRCTAFQPKENS